MNSEYINSTKDCSKTTRRDILKWFAALGAVTACPNFGLAWSSSASGSSAGAEQAYHSACTVNCGNSCFLKAIVRDGRIVRIESDASPDSQTNLANRACLRGRSIREWVYSPDRLQYPMKRIKGAKRGEGRFERISWEEAYQTIAS